MRVHKRFQFNLRCSVTWRTAMFWSSSGLNFGGFIDFTMLLRISHFHAGMSPLYTSPPSLIINVAVHKGTSNTIYWREGINMWSVVVIAVRSMLSVSMSNYVNCSKNNSLNSWKVANGISVDRKVFLWNSTREMLSKCVWNFTYPT